MLLIACRFKVITSYSDDCFLIYENMEILRDFWIKLKEIRLSKWLSQEDLSFKSKLHRTYIGNVERGEKNISLKNILKLSEALEIEIKDFF